MGHPNSEGQEEVRGGRGISRSKNSGWRAKGTQGIVMGNVVLAVACWSGGQNEELCGVHKKVLHMERVWNGRPSMLTLEVCFWFHRPYLAQRALSAIESVEEIKLTYASRRYNLKIFPKSRDRLAPHYQQKLLLKWQWPLICVRGTPGTCVHGQGLRFSARDV